MKKHLIYTKFIGDNKRADGLVEPLQTAARAGGVICHETPDHISPVWRELSNVELLIEIGKGTPIFRFVFDRFYKSSAHWKQEKPRRVK